jgi:hypothetical protein
MYGLFNDAVGSLPYATAYSVEWQDDEWIINRTGYGRRTARDNPRFRPNVWLEGRKTMKIINENNSYPGRFLNTEPSDTKHKS